MCSSNHIFAPKCHEPIPSVKMLLRTTMVEIWIVLVRTWYARVPCESNLPLCFYQTIRRVPYKFPQIVLHATQRNSPTLMLQLNLELCKNTFTRKQICYSRGYLQFWSDCLVRFFWSDFDKNFNIYKQNFIVCFSKFFVCLFISLIFCCKKRHPINFNLS